VPSKHKTQKKKESRFVILIIPPKVSVFFIKQKSKTEEQAAATEEALPFHAVKHCIGDNYSSHCVLFFHPQNLFILFPIHQSSYHLSLFSLALLNNPPKRKSIYFRLTNVHLIWNEILSSIWDYWFFGFVQHLVFCRTKCFKFQFQFEFI
jgi:hypothetical protein